MSALLLCVFTVAVGYGFVLPVLPFLVAERGEALDSASLARHTGLLTAAYVAALALFPPFWRRLSRRWRRRHRVMVIGLAGLGSSLALFTLFDGIYSLYLGRVLDGFFASAVTPVALAIVTARTPDAASRGRRLEWLSIAAVFGFLAGPMLGGVVVPFAARVNLEPAYDAPFLATAAIAYASAIVAGALLARAGGNSRRDEASLLSARGSTPAGRAAPIRHLLLVSLTVGTGLGAFELMLAIRGTGALGLSPLQLGLMFFQCSAVMVLAQSVILSPLVKPKATRWLFAPAFALTAVMVLLLPWTSSYVLLLVYVSTIAASLGVLYPISTYWMSFAAGEAPGRQLALHAAAISLGQALGSAGGGLLYGVVELPRAAVVVTIPLLLVAAMTSRLPRELARLGAQGDRVGAAGRAASLSIDATDVDKGRKSHGPL